MTEKNSENNAAAGAGDGKDNAAAGAAGVEKGAADAGKAAADAGGAAENGSPAIYRPDGMPDHLIGGSDKETIDKLFKTVDGFRKEQSKKGVPETPDGYTLTIPDELKDKILLTGEDGKDPVFEQFKPVFHEMGLNDEGVNKLMMTLYKAVEGIQPPAGEGDEGVDFDFKDYGGPDKAKPIADGVVVALRGLKGQGILDDADVAELSLATLHGAGLRAVKKLIEATGEKIIPQNLGADGGDGELTDADLDEMMKDPRYHNSRKRDPEYVKKVDAAFQRKYGGKK